MTIPMDRSKVSADKLKQYDLFFEKTNPSNINKIASGDSLTKLESLAQNVI